MLRRMSEEGRPVPPGRELPLPLKIDAAATRLGFSGDEVKAILELRAMRARVAHRPDAELTDAEAARFMVSVSRLLDRAHDLERL